MCVITITIIVIRTNLNAEKYFQGKMFSIELCTRMAKNTTFDHQWKS